MKPLPIALAAIFALAAASLVDLATQPAHAALGATAASVEADRMSMKGQVQATSQPGYSIQRITASTGTVVKEYVSSAGVVFAVSWSGPAMPNLQQVLGTYITQLQSAVQTQHAARARRLGHNHLEIDTPTLVVHAAGHMRQYFGIAYVPSLLPQNLSISDLH